MTPALRPLLLSVLVLAACGGGGGDAMVNAIGDIPWKSEYLYFPATSAVTIVRDTLPRDQACQLLKTYHNTPLPAPMEHYSLIITIFSAMMADDVTIDIDKHGSPGDYRYAVVARFAPGSAVASKDFSVDAGGNVRLSQLLQDRHAAGTYNLAFRNGEKMTGSFDLQTCP